MKMLKTLAAASILATIASPAIANPTVYGKVNVTVQNSEVDGEAITELKSNASRLGFKGTQRLEGGLEVFYKYELQVDVSDESGANNLKSRNQFIGIRGSFGELTLGRNDTMLKQSQAKFDVFSDLEADIKKLWKGENRMNDSITYKTPKFNNLQFGISYILDEETDDAATSMSVTFGDSSLKKDNIYLAFAIDNDVKNYDAKRITAGTKVSGVILGAMYQTQENTITGDDKSGFALNAQYKMGKYNVKGQYQSMEDDNGFSVGVDRKLGKNTKAFAYYTSFNFDLDEDENYLALGLEQKF